MSFTAKFFLMYFESDHTRSDVMGNSFISFAAQTVLDVNFVLDWCHQQNFFYCVYTLCVSRNHFFSSDCSMWLWLGSIYNSVFMCYIYFVYQKMLNLWFSQKVSNRPTGQSKWSAFTVRGTFTLCPVDMWSASDKIITDTAWAKDSVVCI